MQPVIQTLVAEQVGLLYGPDTGFSWWLAKVSLAGETRPYSWCQSVMGRSQE